MNLTLLHNFVGYIWIEIFFKYQMRTSGGGGVWSGRLWTGGGGGQKLTIFCGRLKWMTPKSVG